MQKGQGLIFLIGILAVIIIAGGAYYLSTIKTTRPQPQAPVAITKMVITKTPQPTPTPDKNASWKTYTFSNNGFEIKLPKEFIDSGPSIDDKTGMLYFNTCFKTPGDKLSYCINRNGFGEITSPFLFLNGSPKFPICKEEEKTMFVNNQLQKTTYSTYTGPKDRISFSDCNSIPSTSISDEHSSELLTCLDKELKAYPSTPGGLSEAENLCKDKDSLYRLSLICKGESWKGKEGMIQCSKLFDQIISTFNPTQEQDVSKLSKDKCPCWDSINKTCLPQSACQ